MFKWFKRLNCNHVYTYTGTINEDISNGGPPIYETRVHVVCVKCEQEKSMREKYWEILDNKQEALKAYREGELVEEIENE